MNFATLQGLTIPEGVVTQITDASGRVIWAVSGGKAVLEVAKITANTYAGETTYNGEQFILLDIYPKTNGTVKVTYGDLTKTITDTSGAEEPNAQQVFFGTFNGVSDSVTTPASGTLTIEGDYYAFGDSSFPASSKTSNGCACITYVHNFDKLKITKIPTGAFNCSVASVGLPLTGDIVIPDTVTSIGSASFINAEITSLVIPNSVNDIGTAAFNGCSLLNSILILATVPPTLHASETSTSKTNDTFAGSTCPITVLKGYSNTYKTAEGWTEFADRIVEAS